MYLWYPFLPFLSGNLLSFAKLFRRYLDQKRSMVNPLQCPDRVSRVLQSLTLAWLRRFAPRADVNPHIRLRENQGHRVPTINTPYQTILSTHLINPPYQPILSCRFERYPHGHGSLSHASVTVTERIPRILQLQNQPQLHFVVPILPRSVRVFTIGSRYARSVDRTGSTHIGEIQYMDEVPPRTSFTRERGSFAVSLFVRRGRDAACGGI